MEIKIYKNIAKSTNNSVRVSMIALAIALISLIGNKSNAQTQTYVISVGDLINCTNSCGPNSYYHPGAGEVGFGWTDILSPGTIITSISVQFSIGVDCYGGVSSTTLNGLSEGNINSNSWCNCDGSGNSLYSISPNSGDYVIGGANTFMINSPSSSFGFFLDNTLDGYALITVNYLSVPVISGYSSSSGCIGNTLIINGSSLANTLSVTFNNNVSATINSNTSTSITVTVPAGATTGDITVTTSNGTTSGGTYTINGTAPVITCPDNQVLYSASNECNASATFSGSTNTGTLSYSLNSNTITSPYSFPVGVNNVIMTASDGTCTNDCSFNIEVIDTIVPQFTNCPTNVASGCPAIMTFVTPSATDACGGIAVGSNTFTYSGSIENYTVPAGVNSLAITAKGAQGGTSNGNSGGLGASMSGTISVSPGEILKVLVGGQGISGNQGGGGGGSFVTDNSNNPLIVAGGGGGAAYNTNSYSSGNSNATSGTSGQNGIDGNAQQTGGAGGVNGNGGACAPQYNSSEGSGGGGLIGNGSNCYGSTGGNSFVNGGAGGSGIGSGGAGGFGGGGGADWYNWTGAGGGGGYSGGGGGTYWGVGGGGGSFNSGSNQTNISGTNSGNGMVLISYNVTTTNAIVTQTGGLSSGSYFANGVNTINFTATDANGNTSLCSFTITINDATPPVFTYCPADIVSSCPNFFAYTTPTATDDCNVVTVSQTSGLSSGVFFPNGITTNIFIATDGSGNTATCSFTVSVNDHTAPVISNCPSDIIVSNDATLCSAVITYNEPTVTDDCPISTPGGSQTFNYTGTIQSFTVPAGVSSINVDLFGAQGIATNFYAGFGGEAGGTMAVSPGQVINVYVGGQSGFNGGGSGQDGANGGDATDLRTGTDLSTRLVVAGGGGGAGGDSWQCTSGVNANGGGGYLSGSGFAGGSGGQGFGYCGTSGGINGGTSGYSYHGGGGGGGGLTSGGQGAQSAYGTGQSGSLGIGGNSYNSPNCSTEGTGGGGGGYYGGGGAAGGNCGSGQGGGGSSWTGSLTNPILNGGVKTGTGLAIISWNEINFPNIVLTSGLDAGSTFPVGTTTNIYLATDAAGNTTTCSFNVKVNDTELPTLSCVNDQSRNSNQNVCTYTTQGGEFDLLEYNDNCPNLSVVYTLSGATATTGNNSLSGVEFNVGTTEVDWFVTDASGNSASCSLNVTILDAPTVTCPADISNYPNDIDQCYATAINLGTPVTNDVCGSSINSVTNNAPSQFQIGLTVVTWTVTNSLGVTSTCNQNVIVIDNQAPIINCPSDMVLSCPGLEYYSVTATDNCQIISSPIVTQIGGLASGSFFQNGVTTNIFLATDDAGNTSTCSFTITASDYTPPVIGNCPTDIVQSCPGTVTYSTPTVTDNCNVNLNGSITFNYSGSIVSYTVPSGVTSLSVSANGAQGGSASGGNGGLGASLNGIFSVNPADVIQILVGQQGGNNIANPYSRGGGGGGGTYVYNSTSSTLYMAAGGGGGAGQSGYETGNDADASITGSGNDGYYGGSGGTSGSGGGGSEYAGGGAGWISNGGNSYAQGGFMFSAGGTGGAGYSDGANGGFGGGGGSYAGAGGGGGYSGGGGGGWSYSGYGGGGGSFNWGSNPINIGGAQTGNGLVIISYAENFPNIVQTTGLPSGSYFTNGVITNTFLATDGSGNTTVCSFNITVSDNNPPVISDCPADTILLCANIVSYTIPTITDNCSGSTSGNTTFSYSGSIISYTVPVGVTALTMTAIGAAGGYNSGTPGAGASLTGTFSITSGSVLSILVGQSPGYSNNQFPGGGGGTFIASGADYTTATPILIAGGGGGAYSGTGTNALITTNGDGPDPGTNGNGAPAVDCGGGGGGFYSSGGNDLFYGAVGGSGFQQGGAGGTLSGYQTGGFGGGASADYIGSCNIQGGAGGGYSGGSGMPSSNGQGYGWGGGSYNGGTNQVDVGGANSSGNGLVIISYDVNFPNITQISGLPSGSSFPNGVTTNTFLATDGSGNTSSCSFNVTVTNTIPPPVITSSGDTIICNGGSVTLDAGTYTSYLWSTGETTESIIADATDAYSVTVTDANGCTGVSTQHIEVFNAVAPTIYSNYSSTLCQSTSYQLYAQDQNNQWYQTYQWSTNETSHYINANTDGNYCVTVTDSHNCTTTACTEVGIIPTATIVSSLCNGNPATFDAGPGYAHYLWNTNETTETITPLTTEYYYVTVTTAQGCSASTYIYNDTYYDSFAIHSYYTSDNTDCAATTYYLYAYNQSEQLFASYQWSNGGTSWLSPAISTSGTYYLTVTDAYSCSSIASIDVTVLPNPVITPSHPLCDGNPVTFDAGPGYTSYLWNTTENTETISPVVNEYYYVTVTNAEGCSASAYLYNNTLFDGPAVIQSYYTGTTDCEATAYYLYSYNQSNQQYASYHWSTNETGASIYVSTSGTYSVTVTDNEGCTGVASIDVKVVPIPVITASHPLCDNNPVTFDAGPGYISYLWNTTENTETITPVITEYYYVTVTNAAGCSASTYLYNNTLFDGSAVIHSYYTTTTDCEASSYYLYSYNQSNQQYASYHWSTNETGASIYVTSSGTYYVTVTDNNNCTAVASIDVKIVPTPVITPSNPLCDGNPLTFDAGSDYSTYLWNTNEVAETITPVITENYTVTVTNAAGCSASASLYNNDENDVLSIQSNYSNTICTASGYYLYAQNQSNQWYSAYHWSTGETAVEIFVTTNGNYCVTVTDNLGCTGTACREVTMYHNISCSITPSGPTSFNAGGSVSLDAGNWVSYLWSNSATTESITVNSTGNYCVTVTDINGCTCVSCKSVTVIPINCGISTPGNTTVVCEGSSLTLDAGNWTSYLWSTTETTENISITTAGHYCVTITDAYGGTCTSCIDISESNPTPTISGNSPICGSGSVTLDAGYWNSYHWNTNANTESITESSAGTYTVTVTNNYGCSGTASQTVVVNPLPPTPTINNIGSLTFCQGGSVTLDAGGGYSTYHWSTGANTQTIVATTTGNYSVTVSNSSNCTAVSTPVSVTVNSLTSSIDANGPVSFCVGGNVTLNAHPTGNYSYNWSTNEHSSSITVTNSGTYNVTVTDNVTNCNSVSSIVATSNPYPTITASNTGPYCTSYTMELLSAGSNINSYSWSGPNGFISTSANPALPDIQDADAGTYNVTVTGNGNCTATSNTNVVISGHAPYFEYSQDNGFVTKLDNPDSGGFTDVYHFEVMYYDADGNLPAVTYPRLILDYEGNGIFTDPNDRTFIMQEADPNDQNVVDGKLYYYNASNLPNGTTYQSRIIANDNSQMACTSTFGPFAGPYVLIATNISIFANDITFSNQNPDTSSPLTVYAVVHNESDFAASNFVVHLHNQFDSLVNYGDVTVANLLPHSTTTVSWNITTPNVPSWNPMQVTIDYTNVLTETNELDNTAIRPFVCGLFNLPGDIYIDAHVSPLTSYAVSNNWLTVSGQALYRHTSIQLIDSTCAGATVTLFVPSTNATYTGYTNNQGYYSIGFWAPVTQGSYQVDLSVTDYTLNGDTTAPFYLIPYINNCLPDLVSSVSLSSHCIAAGQSINGTYTISNYGCADVTIPTTNTWTSSGSTPSSGNSMTTAPLNSGSSQTFSLPSLTFNTPGYYSVCANADAAFQVVESSEYDNVGCSYIQVLPACPDIAPQSYVAYSYYQCNQASLPFCIYNLGGYDTQDSIWISLHVLNGINTEAIYTQRIGNIPSACGYNVVCVNFLHNFASAGNYTFVLYADTANEVSECNENNNTSTSYATVITCHPDLYVQGCGSFNVTPIDPYNSNQINLSAVIGNSGPNPAVGPFTVHFALSNATSYDYTFPGTLAVGATFTATINNVPTPTAPGVTLTVTADPTNVTGDWNLSNNSNSTLLGYDFAVGYGCYSSWWDYPVVCNQPFNITAYLYSFGSYIASDVHTLFEIQGPGLPVGWTSLGYATNTNVGITCSCPYIAQLPNPFACPDAGTYYLRMTANSSITGVYDSNNPETTYANNQMVISFQSVCLPDYRVLSQYINPSLLNPAPNQPITVDVSYYNIGGSYYIPDSLDVTLRADNTDIETVHGTAELQNGDHTTVYFGTPWSSPIVGVHVLRATVNSSYSILESDTTNNQATRAVIVGSSPDLYFTALYPSNSVPTLNYNDSIFVTIHNGGDLDAVANVIFKYVDQSGDSIQFHAANGLNFPNNQDVSFNFMWNVLNPATTIYSYIVNTNPQESRYDNNEDSTKLGGLVLSINSTPSSCPFTADGSLTVNVTGGVAPYIYSWSNGGNDATINAQAGIYYVTVHDNVGTMGNISGTISALSNPNPNISITTPDYCSGGADTLYAGTWISYSWSTSETTEKVTASTNGTYSVTITNDAGCTASASTEVTLFEPVSVSVLSIGSTTFCQGESVKLYVSAGQYNYFIWSTGATTDTIIVNSSGDYTVTVGYDYYCSATAIISVTVNPLPTPTIIAGGPLTFCQGGNVTLTSSSGNSYLWSDGETTQSITVTTADDYTVTVTDGSNCSGTSDPTTVTIITSPPTIINTPVCEGAISISGHGAPPNAIINVYDNNSLMTSTTSNSDGNWSAGVSGLNAGDNITATAESACGTSAAVTVEGNATLTINSPICAGTSAISGIGAPPNSVVTIYDGNFIVGTATADNNGSWSETVSGLLNGDVITASVDGYCSSSNAVEVQGNTNVIVTGPICAGSVSVNGSGVTPYSIVDVYDNNSLITSTTGDLNGNWSVSVTALNAGDNIIATVEGSCGTSALVTVEGNATLTINSPICAGTSAISGIGAPPNSVVTIYDGNFIVGTATADNNGSWSETVSGLLNGDVITASVDGYCSSSNAVEVQGNTNVIVTGPICAGSVSVNGSGVTPYSIVDVYDNNSLITSTTGDLNGNWSVSVTALNAGDNIIATVEGSCGTSTLVTVEGNATLTINSPICAGTSAISGIGAPPNSVVTIYDGNFIVGTATADNNGSWSETVSGLLNGDVITASVDGYCSSSNAVEVQGNTNVIVTGPICAGSVSVNGSGVTPYSIVDVFDNNSLITSTTADGNGNWTATVTGLNAGDNITVSVPGLCGTSAPVTVQGNSSVIISQPICSATTTISGYNAPPNSIVKIYDNNNLIASATADGNGDWSGGVSGLFTYDNITVSVDGYCNTSNSVTVQGYTNVSVSGPICAGSVSIAGSDAPGYSSVDVFDNNSLITSTTADGNGNWTATVTGLNAGDNITVSVPGLCGTSAPVTVQGNSSVIISQPICSATTTISGYNAPPNSIVKIYDNNNLIASATADGNGDWSGGVSGLFTYDNITVSVDGYCNTSNSVTVQGYTNVSVSGPICAGSVSITGSDAPGYSSVNVFDNNSLITSTTADGNGNWTATVTGLNAGDNITVSVPGLCGTSAPVTVQGNSSVIISQPICSATTTISGYNAPPNSIVKIYDNNNLIASATADGNGDWSGGVSGLFTYDNITVSVDGYCNSSNSVTVQGYTNVSVSGPICAGSVSIAGSDAPGYSSVNVFDNNSLIASVIADGNGNWTATVTVLNAVDIITATIPGLCGTSVPVTIQNVVTPEITVIGNTTFCDGGSVTLTSTAGSSYLWSDSETTQSITVTASGNYNVTMTNGNGCSGVSSATVVTVNPNPPAIQIYSWDPTSLCGNGDVQLDASYYNSYDSYNWSTGNTNAVLTDNISSSTTYCVTVENQYGCSASSCIDINVNPNPSTPQIYSVDLTSLCGSGDVELDASYYNSYSSYNWSTGNTNEVLTDNISSSTTYCVTVENQYGCSSSGCIDITVNPNPPSVQIYSWDAITLCGSGDVQLDASYYNSYDSYNWSNGSSNAILTDNISSSNTYCVTVENQYGCSTSSCIDITVNPLPAPDITVGGNTTFCEGGSVSLTSSAGDSYLWSPNGETTQSINAISSGSYTIEVTTNGCSGTSSATSVTVNPLPAPTITAGGITTFCEGGSVSLTSSAGDSYLWSPNGETTQSINAISSGSYTVEVTINGCSGTSSATGVTVNPMPAPAITAGGITTFCEGGSVSLTSSAGDSYLWSPNGETTQSINAISSGNYTVEVTTNGCSGTSSATGVTVNPLPAPAITAGGITTFCEGGSVTLTSSSGDTYLWSPGGATTQAIDVSSSDSYTVTVTTNGCSGSSSATTVTVNPLPAPIITPSGNTSFCQGESVTLTSTAGDSYLWSPGGATTQFISANSSGSYSVTVTTNGCSGSSSATNVTVNPLPTPAITAGGSLTFCSGGSVTLTSSAGNSYLWSPGGATTQSISATSSGNYTVSTTNGYGCTGTSSATVVTVNTVPAQPAQIFGNANVCHGSVHTYTIAAVSGATSYTWTVPSGWTGTSTTAGITLTSGTSGGTISVTANNGTCSGSPATLTVTVSSAIPAEPGTINGSSTVCGGNTLTYSVAAVNGAAGYIWTLPSGWSGTSTTNSITVTAGTGGGNISVRASNACGNSSARTLFITTGNAPATPGSIFGANTVCIGTVHTYSIASVSGALSYFWSIPAGWSGSSTTTSITVTAGTSGGNILVLSVNGCGYSNSASTLSENVATAPAQPGTISGNSAPCLGTSQAYSVSIVTGATSYTWTLPSGWSGTSSLHSIASTAGSNSGSITVTANNICGSSAAESRSITVGSAPGEPGTINGSASVCQGTIHTYTIAPVTNAASYVWTKPSGWVGTSVTTSVTYTVNATSGSVTVMAINGCGDSPVRSKSITAHSITAVTIAGSPGNFNFCSQIAPTSEMLMASSGFSSYSWSPSGGNTQTATVSAANTYTVTATNSAGCSTEATKAVTNNCPLPTSLDATNITGTSVKLTFIVAQCGVNYTIELSTNQSNWTSYNVSVNNKTINGLSLNTTYYWRVRTNCNSSGSVNSGWSATQHFTTAVQRMAEDELTGVPFAVYPNPASTLVNIAFSTMEEGAYNLRLIDMTGRVIKTDIVNAASGENTYILNLDGIAKGVYMIMLQHGDNISKAKLVVE